MKFYSQHAITVWINQYEWIQINDLLIFMNHLWAHKAYKDVNFNEIAFKLHNNMCVKDK